MLSVLTLGWAVIYADRTCLYPLLPALAAGLGLTSAQAGTLTGIYFLFYVLMQIPAGIAGDRFGLRTVLLIMYTVAGLGLLGLGLWGTSFAALLCFAALHGLGAGAYYPAAYGTLLQATPPARRGFSSAVIGIGMAAGLLGGLAMSGPVYETLGSYRWPFLLLCLPTFGMVWLFRRRLPNIRGTSGGAWAEYRELLQDRQLWLINIATFTALYGFWVAVTWGPTFLKMERGYGLGQAGLYTGLVAVSAVPAGILWGRLSDRLGRKRVALFILPAAAVALYLMTWATDPVSMALVLPLFGMFSNSAFSPVMVAWIGDIVNRRYPGRMGAAVGIFNCTIMTAAIVAPIVSGYLRDATGSLAPAIAAGSCIMAAGTVVILLLPERRPAEDRGFPG